MPQLTPDCSPPVSVSEAGDTLDEAGGGLSIVALSAARGRRLARRAVAARWSALAAPADRPEAAARGLTSTVPRIAKCGNAPLPGGAGLVSLTVGASGSAYYAGVQRCGLGWLCAPCAAAINGHRAEELERGLRTLRETRPGAGVVLVTLTTRHRPGDSLAHLLDTVVDAWSRGVIAGKGWTAARERFAVLGWARALEVTLGEDTGFHPHLHCVLVTERQLSDDDLANLEADLYRRWAGAVVRQGLPRPSRERGVRVDVIDPQTAGVGAYLTKLPAEHGAAVEVARGDLKDAKGERLTPFQLLDLAGTDREGWARRRWAEYEEATWNRRRLTWSRGCRELLGLVEPELSDEEIVEAPDPERTTLAVLSPVQWATLRRHQDGAALVRLLALVEGGHHVQARWWLEGIVGPVLLPGSWAEGGP